MLETLQIWDFVPRHVRAFGELPIATPRAARRRYAAAGHD
jgi:hypothetical protein